MAKKKSGINKMLVICFATLFVLFIAGCSDNQEKGTRDNTPLIPKIEALGTEVYGNNLVVIDASNSAKGYVLVKYMGENKKIRLQITTDDELIYTYALDYHGEYEVFPLTQGNKSYTINVYESIGGDKYAQAYGTTIDVKMENEFSPFLGPNQYVDYDGNSQVIALSQRLAKPANEDLDVVESVYQYILDNIKYDYDRAANVDIGYLPNIDDVIDKGKGICFDYAALATALLRAQGIPTSLVIGYAGEVYHAWINVYIKDVGWVNKVIEFKGTEWVRMDPTYDANASTLDEYFGSGSEYHPMYLY
ncbi:MAG: transglutaminase-like domain-containing protein [Clostridiales bacterium]